MEGPLQRDQKRKAMAAPPDLQRRRAPHRSLGPQGHRTAGQHAEHRIGAGQGRCVLSRHHRSLQVQTSDGPRGVYAADEQVTPGPVHRAPLRRRPRPGCEGPGGGELVRRARTRAHHQGIDPLRVEYPECLLKVGSGDRLLVYTDGLVEADNGLGEAFGDRRMKELVRDYAAARSSDLIQILLKALKTWQPAGLSQQDDITLVVLDVL